MWKIIALSVLGVICFAALIYGLSRNTSKKQSEALLPVSTPMATPSESPTLAEVSTPAAKRSVKTQSKSSVAPKSYIVTRHLAFAGANPNHMRAQAFFHETSTPSELPKTRLFFSQRSDLQSHYLRGDRNAEYPPTAL